MNLIGYINKNDLYIYIFLKPQLYKSKGTQEWSHKVLPSNLKLAHDEFTHALSLEGVSHAEPWIYHFLLGKINWKLKKPLQIVLNHFIKVSMHTCSCYFVKKVHSVVFVASNVTLKNFTL